MEHMKTFLTGVLIAAGGLLFGATIFLLMVFPIFLAVYFKDNSFFWIYVLHFSVGSYKLGIDFKKKTYV